MLPRPGSQHESHFMHHEGTRGQAQRWAGGWQLWPGAPGGPAPLSQLPQSLLGAEPPPRGCQGCIQLKPCDPHPSTRSRRQPAQPQLQHHSPKHTPSKETSDFPKPKRTHILSSIFAQLQARRPAAPPHCLWAGLGDPPRPPRSCRPQQRLARDTDRAGHGSRGTRTHGTRTARDTDRTGHGLHRRKDGNCHCFRDIQRLPVGVGRQRTGQAQPKTEPRASQNNGGRRSHKFHNGAVTRKTPHVWKLRNSDLSPQVKKQSWENVQTRKTGWLFTHKPTRDTGLPPALPSWGERGGARPAWLRG